MKEINNKVSIAATIVLFGGTGDLTLRKLVPALANLVHEGRIKESSTVIGVSRKDWTDLEYKEFLVKGVKSDQDKKYIRDLNVKHFKGDLSNPSSLDGLKKMLAFCEIDGCNRIYYLATSFKYFPGIIKELRKLGLDKQKSGFTRIMFEKPFGEDLKSAVELDSEVHKVFAEKEIYRVDHYLPKETVQNLNVLNFTNPIIYSTLNNKYVESIEIRVDEDLGVGERIGYYNDAGAIKDMIQSHLLQILSLLLMD